MARRGKTVDIKPPVIIENWLAQQGERLRRITEYPLYSDAWMVGERTEGLGPYQLLNQMPACWESAARPAVVLRADGHLNLETAPSLEVTTDVSRYHGGALADEMAALLSLELGVRMKAGGPSRMFDPAGDPKGRPCCMNRRPPLLLGPTEAGPARMVPGLVGSRDLAACDLLVSIPSLDAGAAVALVRSARLYQDAVWIVEAEPAFAWLFLVSAVETAADYWRSGVEDSVARLRVSKPDLYETLAAVGDCSFLRRVADQVAPYMGATKKFLDYALAFLPDEPSTRPEFAAARLDWTPTGLEKPLRQVYDYRSQALHAGIPFPQPMSWPMPVGGALSERPGGLGASAAGGRWAARDLPMLLHVFEHIARGALRNWWSRGCPCEDAVSASASRGGR